MNRSLVAFVIFIFISFHLLCLLATPKAGVDDDKISSFTKPKDSGSLPLKPPMEPSFGKGSELSLLPAMTLRGYGNTLSYIKYPLYKLYNYLSHFSFRARLLSFVNKHGVLRRFFTFSRGLLSACTFKHAPLYENVIFSSFVWFIALLVHRNIISPLTSPLTWLQLSLDKYDGSGYINSGLVLFIDRNIKVIEAHTKIMSSIKFASIYLGITKINSILMPYLTSLPLPFPMYLYIAVEYLMVYFLFDNVYKILKFTELFIFTTIFRENKMSMTIYLQIINAFISLSVFITGKAIVPLLLGLERFSDYVCESIAIHIPFFDPIRKILQQCGMFFHIMHKEAIRVVMLLYAPLQRAKEIVGKIAQNVLKYTKEGVEMIKQNIKGIKQVTGEISQNVSNAVYATSEIAANTTIEFLAPEKPSISLQKKLDKEASQRLGGSNGGTSTEPPPYKGIRLTQLTQLPLNTTT